MIAQYSINSTAWTAITTAGDSGTCWLDEQDDGAAGDVDVRIWHGSAPSDSDVTKGKRVYKPRGNNDMMVIGADDASDIYYARCATPGATATISVDAL